MSKDYLPISEYGMIGNCRTAALVSSHGSIDWACFPEFDSASIFARILDPEGGHFSIAPRIPFRSHQSYWPQSNVLKTEFQTEKGKVELHDSFSVFENSDQLYPEHEVLRVIKSQSSEPIPMKLEFVPRHNYGRDCVRIERRETFTLASSPEGDLMQLVSDHSLSECEVESGEKGDAAYFDFELEAYQKRQYSLVYASGSPAVILPLGEAASRRMENTHEYWKAWVRRYHYQGAYEQEVHRSALALKLLVYASSGALVAAPTTSLPECIGAERNWDYRYCWLRDASLSVSALLNLGYQEEAKAFVNWMLHSTTLTRPRLQILYSIYGESSIPEEESLPFRGYRDSRPVRIGNGAAHQLQLDTYGEVLNSLYLARQQDIEYDRSVVKFLKDLGHAVMKCWDKEDHGLWEMRSGKKHNTQSKLLCWLAMHRLIELSEQHGWDCPLDEYRQTKEKIGEFIETCCFDKNWQSYTSYPGSKSLDASLLQLSILDYEGPRDRIEKTVERIEDVLSDGPFVYRYSRDRDDGFESDEGSFLVCAFWMVQALAKLGHLKDAESRMNSILEHMNSVGLWSEEFDPEKKSYLGNYPQAFTHVGLINAALAINRLKKESKK